MARVVPKKLSMGGPGVRLATVCCDVAALLVTVGLAACGGGVPDLERGHSMLTTRLSESEIARVGRHTITKVELEHWTAVEGVLSFRYHPTQPVPKGLVPDPPAYRECIAYLASAGKTSTGKRRPAVRSLKEQCEQSYMQLRKHIMEILLTDYWVVEEAESKRIKARAQDVQRVLNLEFATKADFRRFLQFTGERPADARFIIESKLLLEKLQWLVSPLRGHLRSGTESAAMAAKVDLSIAKLGDEMKRKWSPLTICRSGYVVSACREYRGSPSIS